MAALTTNYSTSDLRTLVIQEVQNQGRQITPMSQLFCNDRAIGKGESVIRLIHRRHLTELLPFDTTTYAGSSGFGEFEPGVGPSRECTPYARAIYVSSRMVDEYHDGETSKALEDFARAILRDPDVVFTERLEALASTSVSYTTDSGAQTAFLLATSGAPWYTKNDVAWSNIIASALDRGTLNQARAKLAKAPAWYDGKVMGSAAEGPFLLMVPPALVDDALSLVKSQTIPLSVDSNVGDVYNSLAARNITVIENPLLTSDSRAYLFNARFKSFYKGLFTPTQIVVDTQAVPQSWTISASHELLMDAHPFPVDLVRIGA